MSKDISLKSLDIRPLIGQLSKKYSRHAVFAAIILVLLAYIFVVFQISRLSNAEPATGQNSSNPLVIPQVDQKAISNIQTLEDNNTNIKASFDNAKQSVRTNPFQE
jgi:hypothetical protein